jgi:hypothetical protein
MDASPSASFETINCLLRSSGCGRFATTACALALRTAPSIDAVAGRLTPLEEECMDASSGVSLI